MAFNIGIYGNGLFYGNTPISNEAQLALMSGSGFTTVLFWSLHVDGNGNFIYNDTPLVTNGQYVLGSQFQQLVQQLKSTGGVSTVLFSIGAWGTSSDFQNIINNQAAATANFKALIAAVPVDGFDFDYEGDYSTGDQNNIVTITQLLSGLGMKVTYCPYTMEQWWLGCLQQVYANNKRQLVSGYNLQCYAGGGGNDPIQWAKYLANSGKPTGISDPYGFVSPGFWVQQTGSGDGQCPSTMQQTFQQYSGTGINGGWCWNTGDIFTNLNTGLCGSAQTNPADYASAIINGLNGQ